MNRRNIEARLHREGYRVQTFRRLVLAWFRSSGRYFPWRARRASNYVLVVSELLLQRTRAETVAVFFPQFIRRYPNWNALARATEDELRVFLEPIGLWRRRSISLRALAVQISARRGRFPTARDELESLPGVGQYVANAVVTFCQQGREPLLDVNMCRVLERCFTPRALEDIRYDPWLQALAHAVVDHPRAREINWAVLDLAALVCTIRNPQCSECPLQACCQYAGRQRRRTSRMEGASSIARVA